jgi:tRNA-dihydrouridine synthase A
VVVALAIPVASAINLITVQKTRAQVDLIPAVLLGGAICALVTLPLALPFRAGALDLFWLAVLGVFQLAIPCALEVVALRLGGSEPEDLAHCARLGARWGYDEINLNCGCPSPRVQRGAFGACLMAEPQRVADCIKAMRDAVALPVTVKHRIGLGRDDNYAFVRDFVGACFDAGCRVFIVHARNAWLQGLSPKENRERPPLRYEVAKHLKQDFPDATIVLNGGLRGAAALEQLDTLDGVMLGRAAYDDPWSLQCVDRELFGDAAVASTRAQIAQAMADYVVRMAAQGASCRAITRHMMGLYLGQPGARGWRRRLAGATDAVLVAALLREPVNPH